MILKLNDEQMLALWREGAGLEPAFSEASIERFDAVNVDGLLRRAMRAWYIDYLYTAPVAMVPVTDLTDYMRIEPGCVPGQWILILMCETARIVSLEIDGYGTIPIVNPADQDNTPLIRRLANRFVRFGSQPVALHIPGADRVVLNIRSKTAPVVTVRGVEVTGDDMFCVDERVLAQIQPLASKVLNFE